MGWTELRPIQVEAIQKILSHNTRFLVISARTAGGKTEAAFLPILSKIVNDQEPGIKALYVGPLKALINDQFRRVEQLCEKSEIPVYKWHGDVVKSTKDQLIKNPAGVLLITPESIESLFINRPHLLDHLFARLEFLVVDEMHSFIGSERGAHLKSLICRLSAKTKKKLRIIGLSATLGDMENACRWICVDENDNALLIKDESSEKIIKYLIHGYRQTRPIPGVASSEKNQKEESTPADMKLADDIYRAFRNKTALIFVNSKARLESYADHVNRKIESLNAPNTFRVHHASISKTEREMVEEELRDEGPTAVFCSSTLEMGIDVGNVSIIGQIGCPWSVSSLIQRLGRSGRKDNDPSVMRVFVEEYEAENSDSILDRIFTNLLQAAAMTELMLEKWCEPPATNKIHASTCVHQILSNIAETGGLKAKALFSALVAKGAFRNVSEKLFVDILKSLSENDLIEQMDEGDLILGMRGERIVRNYEFYTAFRTSAEVDVIHNDKTIGSVILTPNLGKGGHIILGGKRWEITEVDLQAKEILVIPSKGGRLPAFSGGQGTELHPKIREKMRELIFSQTIPPYLDETAKDLLRKSQVAAQRAKLMENCFYSEGKDLIWFTWTGSKINRTLMGLGKYYGGLEVSDEGIALVFDGCSYEKIRSEYRKIVASQVSSLGLAEKFPNLAMEKFDPFLSMGILAEVFANNCLDLHGALESINNSLLI